MQLPVVKPVTGTRIAFGLEHRPVGPAEQLFRAVTGLRIGGHAQAGADHHILAIHHHRLIQRRDHLANDLGDIQRVFHFLDDDGQFVTTDAHQRVHPSQRLPEPLRQPKHELITLLVTKGFVDVTEIIDIQVQQSQAMIRPLSPQHRLLQPIEEQVPVDEAGGHFTAKLAICRLRELGAVPQAFNGAPEIPGI